MQMMLRCFSELKSNMVMMHFYLKKVNLTILSKFLSDNIVEDLMITDVVTITEQAQIEEAAKLMFNLNVTHIPVVTNGKKLIGIVTTQVCLKVIATNSNDLKEIMTKTVKFCHADDSIESTKTQNEKIDISCLPVVDDDFKLKGIISTDQISHLVSEYR